MASEGRVKYKRKYALGIQYDGQQSRADVDGHGSSFPIFACTWIQRHIDLHMKPWQIQGHATQDQRQEIYTTKRRSLVHT